MSGTSDQFDQDRQEELTENDEKFVDFMLHPETEMTDIEKQNLQGIPTKSKVETEEEVDISTIEGQTLGTPFTEQEASENQDRYRGNQ